MSRHRKVRLRIDNPSELEKVPGPSFFANGTVSHPDACLTAWIKSAEWFSTEVLTLEDGSQRTIVIFHPPHIFQGTLFNEIPGHWSFQFQGVPPHTLLTLVVEARILGGGKRAVRRFVCAPEVFGPTVTISTPLENARVGRSPIVGGYVSGVASGGLTAHKAEIRDSSGNLVGGGTGTWINPVNSYDWSFSFTNVTQTPSGQQYTLTVTLTDSTGDGKDVRHITVMNV
jgi:hypothetical protein